jgi:hypothetical protein
VELLRRYSNRRELLGPLVSALQMVRANAAMPDDRPSVASVDGSRLPAVPARDVIDTQALVAAYQAGATQVELATAHGVSPSTIKRLLRDHGGRKYKRAA